MSLPSANSETMMEANVLLRNITRIVQVGKPSIGLLSCDVFPGPSAKFILIKANLATKTKSENKVRLLPFHLEPEVMFHTNDVTLRMSGKLTRS
jgi:hypothetical protein